MSRKSSLTLLEELKQRQKERAVCADAYQAVPQCEEESGVPSSLIKTNETRNVLTTFFTGKKMSSKPSKAHQTSLSDIKGSCSDMMDFEAGATISATNHRDRKEDSQHSSCIFSKIDEYGDDDEHELKMGHLPSHLSHTNTAGTGSHIHIHDDTSSVVTESTMISTTASAQSINGRKKKKKKRCGSQPASKPMIVQQGSHISVLSNRKASTSISSDGGISSKAAPLSHHNLEQHDQIMRQKRSGDHNVSVLQKVGVGEKENTPPLQISLQQPVAQADANDPEVFSMRSNAANISIDDLTINEHLYAIHIFAGVCSIDLTINIASLYEVCLHINNGSTIHAHIWILITYLLCQVCSAFLISALLTYERQKWMLCLQCVCLLFGNVLYLHGVTQSDSLFLLFLGRGICGVAGSILITGYAQITICSAIVRRASSTLAFAGLTTVGLIVGLLIGDVLLTTLTAARAFNVFNTEFTGLNVGAFGVTILASIYLLLFVACLMHNYFIKTKHENHTFHDNGDIVAMHNRYEANYSINSDINDIKASNEEIIQRQRAAEKHRSYKVILSVKQKENDAFRKKYVVLLCVLHSSSLFLFCSLSAIIVPLGDDQNNHITIGYVRSGVLAFVVAVYGCSLLLNHFWCNHQFCVSISFDKRLVLAIQLQSIGYFVMSTFGVQNVSKSPQSIPLAQLVCGVLCIVVGVAITSTQTAVVYGVLVDARRAHVAARMCWFFAVASAAVILGIIAGFYTIQSQNGSMDLLVHGAGFYCLLLSLVAMLITMEAHPKTALFPQKYYEEKNKNPGTIRSELCSKQRLNSQSLTLTNRSKSRPNTRLTSLTSVHESAAAETKQYGLHNCKMETGELRVEEEKEESKHELEIESDCDFDDNELHALHPKANNRKEFHYSPVQRTQSSESIKISYKPKKTFAETFEEGIDADKNSSCKSSLMQTIKKKSSRFLMKHKINENKEFHANHENVVGLGFSDLQL